MKHRLRRFRHTEPPDLNITAFMNLMVVLVPFLLVMAVFSRMAILELDLPQADATASDQPALRLEVVVRADRLVVNERVGGLKQELPNQDDGYDLAALSSLLQQLKADAPDTLSATLLLEPDLPYEQLVEVMDAVRLVPIREDGRLKHAELFPEISIGDAPVPARRS